LFRTSLLVLLVLARFLSWLLIGLLSGPLVRLLVLALLLLALLALALLLLAILRAAVLGIVHH